VDSDGGISFTPPTGFTGEYTFNYRLENSLDTSDGEVTIAGGERPSAVNDDYEAAHGDMLGNVPIDTQTRTGFKVSSNDEGDGLTRQVKTQSHGTATLNSDGTFAFRPDAGYTGPASFTYEVSNGFGTSDPATVSMNVSGMVWFVKEGAANGGDGRFDSPFNCLSGSGCFDQTTADESNDRIFLHSGNYTGGLTLLNGQRMIGQGATASFDSAAPG
jgi:hypothetical protein